MGFVSRFLRRLGYVRLRDYNLRATVDGYLTPIDSRLPLPIDYGRLVAPPVDSSPWPLIAQWEEEPPVPPRRLAEGTADNLNPVPRVVAKPPPIPRRKTDTIPEPFVPPEARNEKQK